MAAPTFEVTLRDDLTLPQGRYLMSRDQVSELWGFNTHREEIIDGGFAFIDALKAKAPIRSVWISGSLLTDKEFPSDFDVTLLIDAEEHSVMKDGLLMPRSLKKFGKLMGVSVDPYAIAWRPRMSNGPETQQDIEMLTSRGYWDDWWLRRRGRAEGEPEHVEATPRRGYVEVMIDGYA